MKHKTRAQLETEIKRLRRALLPMTRGTKWITWADVKRACGALGIWRRSE